MSNYFAEKIDRHEYEMYEHEIAQAHNDVHKQSDTTDNTPYSDLDVRRGTNTVPTQVQPSLRHTGGQYGSNNTGAKGVQADYKEAKLNCENIAYRNKLRTERQLQQSAGLNITPTIEQMNALDKQHKHSIEESKQQNSDSDDMFSDDDDDELLDKLRSDRLKHIQSQIPTFGTYERINLQQFSSLVKSMESLVYCVAHLYSNSNQACTRLNLSFEALAQRFAHVKFVRIRIDDAITDYNTAGLPTLLVYKGGDMIESAVRITDALPAEFTDYDVACLLQTKSILKVPTGESEVKQFERHEQLSRDRRTFVLSNAHKGYDSDGD